MSITAAMVKELRQITDAPMMACKKALQESNGDLDGAIEIIRKATGAKAAKRADKTAAEGKVSAMVDADNKAGFIVEVNSETDFVARDENFKEFVGLVTQTGLNNKAMTVEALLSVQAGDATIDAKRQALVGKIGENVQVRRVAVLESDGIVTAYCHGDRIGVLIALDKADAELAKDIAMHIAATNPTAITADDVPAELINKEKEIFTAQAKESGKPDNIIEKMITGRVAKFLKEISLVNQPFVKNPDQTVGDLLKEKSATVTAFVRYEVGEGIEKVTQDFADEVMAQVQGK